MCIVVDFSMEFLLMVIIIFYSLGGGVECVLGRLPSGVGMVTPSEWCVNGMLSGGVGSSGIIPSVFALVMHWCVHGAKRICVDAVGVDDVWVLCVGVAETFSAVSPNIFANFCNASPWRFWNVLFYFIIFWIVWVSVVAILFVVSIGVYFGISQCLG